MSPRRPPVAVGTRRAGWVLGVLGLTAGLFLGGLSRPLGGAVGGIAVLLGHRRGVLLGVVVTLGVAELGSRSGVPATLAAGAGVVGGSVVGACVPRR